MGLFMTLAWAAEQRMASFSVLDVANTAWAFTTTGIQMPKLMQKFGATASRLFEQFDPTLLLRFLWSFDEAGGRDESWEKIVASQHVRKYSFPSISLDVTLILQVPSPLTNAKDSTHMSAGKSVRTIGGRCRSGMALWEASFVVAEFLSRHCDLAHIAEIKELMGNGMWWKSWTGKRGVELGAGLGLPSIVASNLGAKMIATDGDDAVLHLLSVTPFLK